MYLSKKILVVVDFDIRLHQHDVHSLRYARKFRTILQISSIWIHGSDGDTTIAVAQVWSIVKYRKVTIYTSTCDTNAIASFFS